MKKPIIIILIISITLLGCNKMQIEGKKTSNVNVERQDSLAFELCQIYGLDQGVRNSKGFPGKMKLIQKIDSFNFKRILHFVKINGIPNKELLGENNMKQECVESAMTAVLLHNPHILVDDRKSLNVFLAEVDKGNLKKEYLATVLDKYYWAQRDEYGNKKVLYGSQFGKPCKKYRTQSDSVRAIIGLKPLPDSLFVDCNKNKVK